MTTKILYRTCYSDHTSYKGFSWGGIGEITTAPDWDPDPKIDCGNGLHGCDEVVCGDYLRSKSGILQIIEVDNPVLSSKKDKYRFESAKTIEEYTLPCSIDIFAGKYFIHQLAYEYCKNMNLEEVKWILEKFEGKWLYWAGKTWKGITDETRRELIKKLEGELLYMAGLYWSGITDDIRRELITKLSGKWLYFAGMNWSGIADYIRIELIEKLAGKWLHYACMNWPGIADEDRQSLLIKLSGK